MPLSVLPGAHCIDREEDGNYIVPHPTLVPHRIMGNETRA
jgi:hypothetical protein